MNDTCLRMTDTYDTYDTLNYIQMKELDSKKDVIVIIDDDTVEYHKDIVEYQDNHKDSCCICLDEDELDYLLECCKNKIHSKCLRTWYSYKKSQICPLCKHGSDQNYEDDLLTALIPTENEARMIVRPLIYLFVYLMIVVILKLK
jgi:hypothetical protein